MGEKQSNIFRNDVVYFTGNWSIFIICSLLPVCVHYACKTNYGTSWNPEILGVSPQFSSFFFQGSFSVLSFGSWYFMMCVYFCTLTTLHNCIGSAAMANVLETLPAVPAFPIISSLRRRQWWPFLLSYWFVACPAPPRACVAFRFFTSSAGRE